MSIIVEGPDGAGKTTLVQELQNHFPRMDLHPRFCTSVGGPVANLAEEVYKDVTGVPTHFIYDRHPTISEYVYNAAIPGRTIRPAFLSDTMGGVRQRVAQNSIMVFCLPPFSVVYDNCIADELAGHQMLGVIDNIERIYEQYQMHYQMWPGLRIKFDYTNYSDSWRRLISLLSSSRGRFWKESA
jgi:hypothetical protein